ncbi:MAG TPA: helix-turn-helix domain-containing protein [Chthoniobacterales bacterium]
MTYFAKLAQERTPKLIGLLGYDDVAALDLTGPLEALTSAQHPGEASAPLCYRPIIVGLANKSFTSESGLHFKADVTAEEAPIFDTIIIPGGKGLRRSETRQLAARWLNSQAGQTRRIASVSTGIYALAQSGLVDGRHVTTHWRFARDVAQRFPKIRISRSVAFLKDEAFYSSAGGTAGIEMTLALIQEDYGGEVARNVARELVMRLRPPGVGGDDFEPSVYQADPTERVAELPAWILGHLHERMTVDSLAERTCLCPRHFSRLFKQVFECTPADFVEELRLSEARRRLLGLRTTVESVAESVGFKSSDAFRRAFERRVGVTPTAFRRQASNLPTAKVVRPHRAPLRSAQAHLKHAVAA